ncbi:MAG TPA: ASKHA domain-containing protein, partial [Anaerohalosphaeraceae bacterium]|nr:ASKHA domain-containing protein [Anaerohalosphaeraceae bacterium]
AKTICGSGLIDAVATMLDLGVIGSNGGFSEKKTLESRVSQSITERIIEYRGQPAFVLAWKESSSEPSVVLTQKDIREVQLAKAAISTGIRLLLKTMHLTEEQIERLYLAGAFGNYIQKRSAIRIGLLPNIPEGKIHFIGNAAGSGAYMSLINRQCRQTASDLARRIQYIEIARERDFQDVFAESILFP